VQALKAHSLNLLLKTSTQLVDARKSRFASNTSDPLCAKDTKHLTILPEMVAFKDLFTLDIGYPSSLDLHL